MSSNIKRCCVPRCDDTSSRRRHFHDVCFKANGRLILNCLPTKGIRYVQEFCTPRQFKGGRRLNLNGLGVTQQKHLSHQAKILYEGVKKLKRAIQRQMKKCRYNVANFWISSPLISLSL
ncbi:hypothetical protein HUJ04_009176 [Dendroctonus ponderosae]|nr:hypothetical protein HUJ04_009176 [Dendroctonus ponderosae]